MAAPTLVAFATNEGSVGSGTNVTTASLSWQANDVIVVFGGNEGNGTQTLNTPTTTGSGITFGTAQKLHQNASDCGGGCWAAVASATSSGTFSINDTHSGNRNVLIGVYIFRGSAGIGNSALSTGTSRTVSLTPTAADASIAWMVLDWNADTIQSLTPTATSHNATTPGPSATPVSTQIALTFSYYLADLDDQTSSGAVSYGVGGTNTGPFTIIAIEAKPSGGTNATVTPTTVAAVGGVGSPVKSTGSTVAAVMVAAVAAIGSPAVQTGNNTTVTPTTVAAVAAVPAPTLHTGSTVAPTTVAAVGGVGAMQGATGSTLTPATAAAIGVVPAPTVVTSGNATVAAATVAGVAAVPAPSVSTGSNATVAAVTVAGVAGVGSPALSTGSRVTPATVAAVGAIPAPTVSSGSNATVTAVTVAAVSAVTAPTITLGTGATPATATAIAAVPAPTLHTSATVTPATVSAAATVPTPVGIGDISGFGVPVRNPVLHVTSLASILRLDFVSSALSFTSPTSTLELT